MSERLDLTGPAQPAEAAELAELSEQIYRLIDAELPAACALRREIHANPRLSGEEQDTADLICANIGIDFTGIAETGAYTRLGPESGPAIAVRGEMDALPVEEETGVSWASTNGAMHACGHDVHMAGLAAFVRAAKQLRLPVALLPILQPREEKHPSGAYDVRESGLFDAQNVAYAIGVHVHPGVAKGAVATGAGVVNAEAGVLKIRVHGQGGHGAYPHLSRDVVAPLAAIAAGIHEVVRRTVDPMHPALVSVGQMIADGGAANVLPNEGLIHATIRTTRREDTLRLVEALRAMTEQTAAAYNVSGDLEYIFGEPVLANDAALSVAMDQILREKGLEVAAPMRSLGADDFAFFSDAVPSVMAFVGTRAADDTDFLPLHNPRFLPDEDAVRRVAYTMAAGYLAGAELLLAE
ncbi:MAG: M20 family metallopeptidase [Microbacteriaceae bacterium]|nr:M20 family metallopeptidase [Microbacteriaceae bacterium]